MIVCAWRVQVGNPWYDLCVCVCVFVQDEVEDCRTVLLTTQRQKTILEEDLEQAKVRRVVSPLLGWWSWR